MASSLYPDEALTPRGPSAHMRGMLPKGAATIEGGRASPLRTRQTSSKSMNKSKRTRHLLVVVSSRQLGADGQELDMFRSGDLHTAAEAILTISGLSGTRPGHGRGVGGGSGSGAARCGLRRHLESTCRGCSSCWPTGASAT